MSTPRARWCLLLLALLVAAGDAGTAPTRRIAIIGASVSDGFGVRLRAAAPKADGTRPSVGVDLAALLRAAASDPEGVSVSSHATSRFFLSPETVAKGSVRKVLLEKPTLVLAIDWLFWSSYGSRRADGEPVRNCDDRAERLERALAALQPLVDTGVPIVLGDLHQPPGEVLHAQFRDRVAVALHRQHALRLERHRPHHGPHAAPGMGEHVAVVEPIDVDHLLPLHRIGGEEVEVHAERLVANLREHVFVVVELAVDPLPLDDGARIVLDRGPEVAQPALGQFQRRIERMRGGRNNLGFGGIGVALRQTPRGHEAWLLRRARRRLAERAGTS